MRRSLPPFAALGLAACAMAADPIGSRAVGPDYVLGGGAFNTGTRVTVAADTFEADGNVGLCAAWAADDISAMARPYLDDVLGIGVVQLGGRNLLQGFDRFPRASSRQALVGAPAGCVLTGQAWRPEYAAMEPEIQFGRMTLERDDEGFGGPSLWFSGD